MCGGKTFKNHGRVFPGQAGPVFRLDRALPPFRERKQKLTTKDSSPKNSDKYSKFTLKYTTSTDTTV